MNIISSGGDVLNIAHQPFGRGGEGNVYKIHSPSKHNQIVKIYHELPSYEMQQKLLAMINQQDTSLRSVCAWPIDVVRKAESGEVCGFLMEEIKDSEPIHHYYSPRWRKQHQPKASWASLISLARNVAAAFAIVHSRNIVIGDINPNSVRVRKNGKVVLIDCDSFQIQQGQQIYQCGVGVPNFTPPELQNIKSFKSVERTINHDCFGLSLLIFHILFMGRHPFAGTPVGDGEMLSLEKAIAKFQYAYSIDAYQRGIQPPPKSIQPSQVVSSVIVNRFQNDFTEIGIQQGRTLAELWYRILDRQLNNLKTCQVNLNHKYHLTHSTCIWCLLDNKGLNLFLKLEKPKVLADAGLQQNKPTKNNQINQILSEIKSIPPMKSYQPPSVSKPSGMVRKLGPAIEKAWQKQRQTRLVGCSTFILILVLLPYPLTAVLIAVGLLLLLVYTPAEIQEQREILKSSLEKIESEIVFMSKNLKIEKLAIEDQRSLRTIREIIKSVNELEDNLDVEKELVRQEFYQSMLKSYLSKLQIDDARSVKTGEKLFHPSSIYPSLLRLYGVQSAADISLFNTKEMLGIERSLIDELNAWEKSEVKKFQGFFSLFNREPNFSEILENHKSIIDAITQKLIEEKDKITEIRSLAQKELKVTSLKYKRLHRQKYEVESALAALSSKRNIF